MTTTKTMQQNKIKASPAAGRKLTREEARKEINQKYAADLARLAK